MLTYRKKAEILAKVGLPVPPFPGRKDSSGQGLKEPHAELDEKSEQGISLDEWNETVESLFVTYTAVRAAKSLRESEDALRLSSLRQANRSRLRYSDH